MERRKFYLKVHPGAVLVNFRALPFFAANGLHLQVSRRLMRGLGWLPLASCGWERTTDGAKSIAL